MAKITNPRKKFNFTILIAGVTFNSFLAQKVTLPEREVEVVEHGDTNYDVKTGGRVKFGMLTIEKIMTTSGPDNYFEDWMASIQDPIIGGGLTPTNYKRTVTVSELAEDGVSVINQWVFTGAWPSKRNAIELDRTQSDNTIEQIELCVDIAEKV